MHLQTQLLDIYFNPRPPCGGRRAKLTRRGLTRRISIHVPRVEDDASRMPNAVETQYFNPRPPCGGRPKPFLTFSHFDLFQSTSPVWRTTGIPQSPAQPAPYFNPRPPCGGRPAGFYGIVRRDFISIHVPRVEDDVRL